MDENNIFSIRLKEARKNKDITQAELSRITGIAPATLSSYEKDGKNPTIDKAVIIANALDVSLDWMCGNEKEVSEEFKFEDIANALIFLFKYLHFNINFDEKFDENDYTMIHSIVTLTTDSGIIYNFLKEYVKIVDFLNSDDTPKYLKDGLIKVIIDKFKNTSSDKINERNSRKNTISGMPFQGGHQ